MSAAQFVKMVSSVLQNFADPEEAETLICAIVAKRYGGKGGRPRKTCSNLLQPVSAGGSISVSESDSESEQSKSEDENRLQQVSPRPCPYSAEFLAYWAHYPRGVGKGAAWESWKKQKPPIADVLRALEWQCKQRQWTAENGAYVPLPTTYLNQRRWEDEPPKDNGPQYRVLK